MAESIHDKLKRVRKPHVHITMDIEGKGLPKSELPCVVGITGDFSGDNPDKKTLEERRPIEIDRDTFPNIMSRIGPKLTTRVENVIKRKGKAGEKQQTEFPVELSFNSMDDFEPKNLVENVEPLKRLFEARTLLRQLASVMDRSKGGDRILEEILQDPNKLERLRNEVEAARAKQAGS